MRCSHVQRLSTAYLDGELDPDRSSAVRGHLRTCERCSAAIEDEAAVRRAASQLEPDLDPPAALWERIQEQLASEEIRDADRSRFWLACRRARAALSPYRAHVLVAGGLAAVLLALGLQRSRVDIVPATELARAEVTVEDVSPALFAPDRPAAADLQRTHLEQAMHEIHRADRRYATAIVELQEMVRSERDRWSAEAAARFDAEVARFERRARELEHRLAARIPDDPRQRDRLYDVYREHIDYLERAVLGEVGE